MSLKCTSLEHEKRYAQRSSRARSTGDQTMTNNPIHLKIGPYPQRSVTAGVIPRPHLPFDFSGRFTKGQDDTVSFEILCRGSPKPCPKNQCRLCRERQGRRNYCNRRAESRNICALLL